MAYINKATDEQLNAELKRISAELQNRQAARSIHPSRLDTIDWNPLIKMVEEAEAKSAADGYEDDDNRAYIYQEVMTAIYGPNYFAWRRKQCW